MTRNDIDKTLLHDVFKAYYSARKNKRNTINQLRFEMNLESNLIELAAQIEARTYRVGRSVCFIVEKPVKREIFAADFRDRVVHHLVFSYINPLFDSRFIDDSYSCRKGYGTSKGIQRMEHHIRSVSENYSKPAYVLKLDLQGYFMSINRRTLYQKLERAIASRKNRKAKRRDLCLYLLREIVFNEPTIGCKRKGAPENWNGLPPAKSLFYSPTDCGLPIGNLTSQLFSNIYLDDFDQFVKRKLKVKHYGRYVDDFFLIHNDKQQLIRWLGEIREYLEQDVGLAIHPRKIFLQEVKKGVDFVGAHFKPFRRYVKSKTLVEIRKSLHGVNRNFDPEDAFSMRQLEQFVGRFNSNLGYLIMYKTYTARRQLLETCMEGKQTIKQNKNYSKLKIDKRMLNDIRYRSMFNVAPI